MTAPHLMNCEHRAAGHCAECVRNDGEERLHLLLERDQLRQQLAEMTRQRDEAREAVQPSVDLAVVAATSAITEHRDELERQLEETVDQLHAASGDAFFNGTERDESKRECDRRRATSKKLAEHLGQVLDLVTSISGTVFPQTEKARAALADYSKGQL